MKVNHTNIIKSKVIQTKIDYSHITSRLFSSCSKSKILSKCLNDQNFKSIRHSKQKIQSIGQAKYKQAMKHMNKFNKYEYQKNKRKQLQNQIIEKQCTFKPKINKSIRNNNYIVNNSMMLSSKYLYQSKKNLNNQNQLKKQQTNKIKPKQSAIQFKKQNKNFQKKTNKLQTAQRLHDWGKQRDVKVLNKTIQIEVSRSISKESSYSKKSGPSSICNSTSYNQLHMKKLNLTLSSVIHQSQEKYYNIKNSKFISNNLTSKTDKLLSNHPLTNRSTNSLIMNQNYQSMEKTPRGQTMNVYPAVQQNYQTQQSSIQDSIGEKNQYIPSTQKRKTRNKPIYNQINPQIQDNIGYKTYGQKLLAHQSVRGEGSFYLRQARANIMKNYQKGEVLVKDQKYSNKFSILNKSQNVTNAINKYRK